MCYSLWSQLLLFNFFSLLEKHKNCRFSHFFSSLLPVFNPQIFNGKMKILVRKKCCFSLFFHVISSAFWSNEFLFLFFCFFFVWKRWKITQQIPGKRQRKSWKKSKKNLEKFGKKIRKIAIKKIKKKLIGMILISFILYFFISLWFLFDIFPFSNFFQKETKSIFCPIFQWKRKEENKKKWTILENKQEISILFVSDLGSEN